MRFPTEEEKRLYLEATGREAPACLLIRFWVPGWGVALALGPLILHEKADRPDLIVHEMVHVQQFYDRPFTFWLRYFWYSLTEGYRENPYEIEAREAQSKV